MADYKDGQGQFPEWAKDVEKAMNAFTGSLMDYLNKDKPKVNDNQPAPDNVVDMGDYKKKKNK